MSDCSNLIANTLTMGEASNETPILEYRYCIVYMSGQIPGMRPYIVTTPVPRDGMVEAS